MNANPLFDGIAWEYQNYATKWSSRENEEFLKRIGVTKEDLRSFSYTSIWQAIRFCFAAKNERIPERLLKSFGVSDP